jgi:hypothetical protein
MAWVTRWRVMRLAGIVLVILALFGPWGYDRLSVPAEFECQYPTIRLDEDFCGWPIPGSWLITELVTVVISIVNHTSPGIIGAKEIGSLLLWFVGTLVIIAPIISLVLRLKNRQTRWAWVHIAVLILVTALAGYLLFHTITHQPMQVWGLWLYVVSVFFIIVEQAVVEINHYRHQFAI